MTFEDALTAAGLFPRGGVAADGRWHRCATVDHPRKRNGAYKLALDGRIGWWRNWATDAEPSTWRPDEDAPAPKVDWAAIEERRRQERVAQARAVAYARKLYADAAPYSPHAYLSRKGLSTAGCSALRVWSGEIWVDDELVRDEWLVVPMFVRGQLVNIQRIDGSGRVKRPVKGAPARAAYFELARSHAAVTVLAEGLATGLAVFQSVRHARVVVTFNADGLVLVAQALQPTGNVVIAADNDWGTEARGKGNPGIQKAEKAAELIGCGVAWPEGIEGTDWCDAHREWGERAPHRIQREILSRARLVRGGAMP